MGEDVYKVEYEQTRLWAHEVSGNKRCFIIGGITDVPAKEFALHIELINHILYLLEFKYGVEATTALRDAERNLDGVPKEDRAKLCYEVDQTHVAQSDFIIAILNSPSTGTGQELERAATLGIPVIALVMEPKKHKLPRKKDYVLRHNDSRIEDRKIYVAKAQLSIMVAGNPVIKNIIEYKANDSWNHTKHHLVQIVHKIGWCLKIVDAPKIIRKNADKIGDFFINKIKDGHLNISHALTQLDSILKNDFRLTPRTEYVSAHIQEWERKKSLNEHGNMIDLEIKNLKEKKKLLDDLSEFNPLRLNHELDKYDIFRIYANKKVHMFTKKYSTKALRKHMQRQVA